jgi:anti-sigma factor RsiW
MTEEQCAAMRLLIQADLDGELDAGQAATLAAHVEGCRNCATTRKELAELASRLRTEVAYHAAPASLRRAVEARIAAAAPAAAPPLPQVSQPWRSRWLGGPGARLRQGISFGAGFALAASVALVLMLPHRGDLAGDVVAGHIRALQPGHLTDVVSTDQHTVKPWFNGRLDFSPPVKDFASRGFPLVGGRLDYLDGRPVAALVYHRAQHVIDLYVWPDGSGVDLPPGEGTHNGYNYVRWSARGMTFWAVSDVNAAELRSFVDLWRAG